jgi:transmembrane sensor
MKAESRNLARHLRPASDPETRERVWRGVAKKASPAPRRSVYRPVGGVVIAVAAAAALMWWTGSDPAEGLVTESGDPLRSTWMTAERAESTRLSDGSRVEVAGESVLEVVANDAHVFSTVVRGGRARFEVRPGGRRRWLVEAGPARVEVVGTVFTVERRQESTRVVVERGRVVVRGPSLPDGVVVLGAGGDVWVHPQTPRALHSPRTHEVGAAEAPASEGAASEGAAREPEAVTSEAVTTTSPDAVASLGRGSLRGEASTALTLDDRLALADDARRAGRFEQARTLLLAVIAEAPGDARAPVATFTVARLELDELGATASAARRFREVADHPHAGSLAPEALARAVTAFERAANEEAAEEARREYLRRFPDGRHARRWRP